MYTYMYVCVYMCMLIGHRRQEGNYLGVGKSLVRR